MTKKGKLSRDIPIRLGADITDDVLSELQWQFCRLEDKAKKLRINIMKEAFYRYDGYYTIYYDPIKNNVYDDLQPSSNTWLPYLIQIWNMDVCDFEPFFDCDVELFDDKKALYIAETYNTLWDDLGRKATQKEIEEYDIHAESSSEDPPKNARVMSGPKMFEAMDYSWQRGGRPDEDEMGMIDNLWDAMENRKELSESIKERINEGRLL